MAATLTQLLPLGFRYVDSIDTNDGKLYRYVATVRHDGAMDINSPNVKASLRENPLLDINLYKEQLRRYEVSGEDTLYGITFDDI